ncbi:MAG: FAD-dependent oxidoreductase [Spirochaetes bacterium]|nr:FAD-dependent oxidoreductase [Spirochaetota bacterium]
MKNRNILIIGAGIKGLSIAYQILSKNKDAAVTVVDKEPQGVYHMSDSSHNTQCGHSGLYYTPGTLKAILNQHGFELLRDYIINNKLPYNPCGKVVVGYGSEKDNNLLDKYYKNALGNGRPANKVRMLDGDALREKEPLLSKNITSALEVDDPYLFDANSILKSLEKDVTGRGGVIKHNTKVKGISSGDKDRQWTVKTSKGDIKADFIVNAAGAQVDRIAKMAGGAKSWFICPVVGVYKDIKNTTDMPISHMIYQVPSDPEIPFLDPHAIESHGGIHFGPTAMVKFGMREHYSGNFLPHLGDMIKAHFNPGTWFFYMKNLKNMPRETGRHYSNKIFAKACQGMLNESRFKIDPSALKFYKRGIRGQHISLKGVISNDFGLEKHMILGELRGITDINPGSPGFTAALAVGLVIADITASPEKYMNIDFSSKHFLENVKHLLESVRK